MLPIHRVLSIWKGSTKCGPQRSLFLDYSYECHTFSHTCLTELLDTSTQLMNIPLFDVSCCLVKLSPVQSMNMMNTVFDRVVLAMEYSVLRSLMVSFTITSAIILQIILYRCFFRRVCPSLSHLLTFDSAFPPYRLFDFSVWRSYRWCLVLL